jgi:hypothetical protein
MPQYYIVILGTVGECTWHVTGNYEELTGKLGPWLYHGPLARVDLTGKAENLTRIAPVSGSLDMTGTLPGLDEDYTWPGLVKSSSRPGDADAGFPRQESP